MLVSCSVSCHMYQRGGPAVRTDNTHHERHNMPAPTRRAKGKKTVFSQHPCVLQCILSVSTRHQRSMDRLTTHTMRNTTCQQQHVAQTILVKKLCSAGLCALVACHAQLFDLQTASPRQDTLQHKHYRHKHACPTHTHTLVFLLGAAVVQPWHLFVLKADSDLVSATNTKQSRGAQHPLPNPFGHGI